jgi:cobalamin biosynthesis Mg chelatase CobN
MHKEQGHTVESAVEARAGFRDRPVLVVLAVSVLLICVLFGLVYMGFFTH